MSTWIYLQCHDHEPHLESHCEVGQHMYDVPRVREMLAKRESFKSPHYKRAEVPDGMLESWFRESWLFIREHPHCDIHIVTEYGDDVTKEKDTATNEFQ